MAPPPLVSILIPAYNPRFLGPCLQSALDQTYENVEILVGDDSEKSAGAEVAVAQAGQRVAYSRNAERLGFHGNFAALFLRARGHYVKFLNHDDVLEATCVARMVSAFEFLGPRISLVTSRRRLVDESGDVLLDTAATKPLADRDCTFDGRHLGDALLVQGVNRIGEPSTTMFRRSDVWPIEASLFRIHRRQYTCLADMALWLRLLARGSLAYLAAALSRTRVHRGQLQLSDEVAARCMVERYHLPLDARRLGFLQDEADFRSAVTSGIALVRNGRDNPRLSPAARAVFDEVDREIAAHGDHGAYVANRSTPDHR